MDDAQEGKSKSPCRVIQPGVTRRQELPSLLASLEPGESRQHMADFRRGVAWRGVHASCEHAHEDLLREATALVDRVELVAAFEPPHGNTPSVTRVVVGFRRDGSASVFWDGDPVYQFNRRNELRRGFWQGRMLKAEQGRLVALSRHRTPAAVQLLREPLSASEQQTFLTTLADHLCQLQHAIQQGQLSIAGQVPADTDVLGRVRDWLVALPLPPTIASHAAVR